MEKKMESIIMGYIGYILGLSVGYVGIMEKKKSYYLGFRVLGVLGVLVVLVVLVVLGV